MLDVQKPLTRAMGIFGLWHAYRASRSHLLSNTDRDLTQMPKAEIEQGLRNLPAEAFKGRHINPAAQPLCRSLVEQFQSLGHNCEFGFLQRFFAAEPLDLFRFSGATPDGIAAALETRFSAFQNIENLAIEFEGEFENGQPQMAVAVKSYGFRFHAGNMPANTSFDDIKAAQWKKLTFLARKFREDLIGGERIFVCRHGAEFEQEIVHLAEVMRTYGPTDLLWVSLEAPGKPAGTVERISDGLLRGYIDRYAEPRALNQAMICRLRRSYRSYAPHFQKLGGLSVPAWLAICCNAFLLHIARPAAASTNCGSN